MAEKKSAAPLVSPQDPRYARHVIGHSAVARRLAAAVRDKNFPAALLLTGEDGVGKATLAWCAAKALLGAENLAGAGEAFRFDERDPVVMKAESGGHPDLRALAPEQSTPTAMPALPVAKIREATAFLSMTASGPSGKKCVIVDGAECMNPQAQNALLKALEEPSGDASFILACSRPEALLPTVRSRCIRMKLGKLTPDECAEVLERAAPTLSAERRLSAARAAGFSPGRACVLIGAGLTDLRASVWRALRDQAEGKEPSPPEGAERPEIWRLTLGVLARVTRDAALPDALLPDDMTEDERLCRAVLRAQSGEGMIRRLEEVYAMAARHGESLYLEKKTLLRLYFAAAAE